MKCTTSTSRLNLRRRLTRLVQIVVFLSLELTDMIFLSQIFKQTIELSSDLPEKRQTSDYHFHSLTFHVHVPIFEYSWVSSNCLTSSPEPILVLIFLFSYPQAYRISIIHLRNRSSIHSYCLHLNLSDASTNIRDFPWTAKNRPKFLFWSSKSLIL